MFKIIEGDFKNNKYSNEEYLDNWPLLYILENGKQAYIGESTHAKTRMTQHASVEEKTITVNPAQYYDKNGSRTAEYQELLNYITNIYYVLLTRGIKGTYLYVCNDDLRDYLSQFIEME